MNVCTECDLLLCRGRGGDPLPVTVWDVVRDVVNQGVDVGDHLGGVQGLVISSNGLTIVVQEELLKIPSE